MTERVVLASSNPGKVRELMALFAEPRLELVSMRDWVAPGFEIEETGSTFAENAWLKALGVCAATDLPALADDSGLEVDALGGRPGVYSARYAGPGARDEDNNALLLRKLAGVPSAARSARFVAVLALAAPGRDGPVRVAVASGVLAGRIRTEPHGAGGFGYDPLFEPVDLPGRTTAELSLSEKNAISHRARAARALGPALREYLASLNRAPA